MAATPGAFQLRLLQTVVDVAAAKNSTLVMPFPVEMLRFYDQLTGGARLAAAAEPPNGQTVAEGQSQSSLTVLR